MDSKYLEMYISLKEEAENAMTSKSIENCIEDFKNAVNEKTDLIHKEIDEALDEFLEVGLKAMEANEISFVSTSKKETESEPIDVIDEKHPFELKSKKLAKFIESLNKKSNSKSRLITALLTNEPYDLLKYNKDQKLEISLLSRARILCSGKSDFELGWLKNQNQPSYSSIDTTDDKTLIVKGTGCYNYYRTDKEIKEENVYAEFESTVVQNDNYYYFGVHNETCVPSSNCMCCTVAHNCYIYHGGNICVHGSSQSEPAFEFKSKNGAPTILRIRVMALEKECFFQVGDNEEKGPYKLVGNRFTITFGSCNTSNGKIKILGSYLI